MKTYKMHTRKAALAILLVVLLRTTVLGSILPIEFDVTGKGETVGKVKIAVETSGSDEGLKGGFDATKKKPDGTTMTIDELEKFLGQDHLNWFQKVTRDTDPPKDSGNNPLVPPYIDPPKDGYSDQWADDIPWYWDEKSRPAGETRPWDTGYLLSNNVAGSTLSFEDFPGGSKGTEVDFVTFLISDFGNKTYDVLGGFSWKMKVGTDGFTDITALSKGAKFTSEFRKEIKDGFGYKQIPEPSAFITYAGLFGTALIGYWRRRRKLSTPENDPFRDG